MLSASLFSNVGSALCKPRATIAVPILIDAAPETGGVIQLTADRLFADRSGTYRSLASLTAPVRVAFGRSDVEVSVNDRLVEVRAKNLSGTVYCKADPPARSNDAVLTCLIDPDTKGVFSQVWLGIAQILVPLRPFPALRYAGTIPPVAYNVQRPGLEERFRIGLTISGSNPLLGQHHFYLATQASSGPPSPFIETHKAFAIGSDFRIVYFEGAMFKARKASRCMYEVEVIRSLPAGERELVANDGVNLPIIIYSR